MSEYNFQVNLKGMIDLLSNHLYSNPGVFIRELLQNGADAVTARKRLGHNLSGKITVELFPSSHTLAVQDNGIGLTEREIIQFLAQIGHTSKREDPDSADEYIGQFGVGLLACFVVSEEIVLITRSAMEGDSIEWRGRPDGTYTIRKLDREVSIGTTVYLTLKQDYEEYGEWYRVYELLEHYGAYLPAAIWLVEDGYECKVNHDKAPWSMTREEALAYAKDELNLDCLDVIELRSTVGEVEGVAYILPYPVSLQAERRHKMYVKQMLLSDKMDSILPSWAFFATSVINANGLRPTASREAFYENDIYYAVQNEMGEVIKQHFRQLAEQNPELLRRIIRIHYSSLKTLAEEDEDSYELFIPYLAFETSEGTLEAEELAVKTKHILLTSTLDEFRQISRVAKAQDLLVVNGGYVHDYQLIRRLPDVYPELEVTIVDPLEFFQRFQELDREDTEQMSPVLEMADALLLPYQCKSAVRWFEPADIAVLYTTSEDVGFLRMAESGRDELNELFDEAASIITNEMHELPFARLCFNYNNPIVRKMAECKDLQIQDLTIKSLYTQSLLLGSYPMQSGELQMMNESFMTLLNLGLANTGGGVS
ncbi:HSP90 family protein [Paenibacillus sambharensis]|uniref:HSP90 family protein n=1 Tax=Paenibacillus sambharensis TaxID=1803190 RepID=A0A2W1M0B8_9BACL|nr:HSP90 family protein [Paenibacillus sambharensis]PZD97381.1 HSP90 family protein [Paenibacillus sambharensis]